MGRETYLADLYRQSVQALTQNRTEWMGLLSSVSKYYKMSFDKNVLIYVQRPDALSYTQDNMGIYYETGDRTEKQMEDLMGFFDQWMANIKEQGFTLYKAYGEDAEYTKEEEHTEETGYTVISADNLKQMDRFDGEDMENER